MGSAAIATIEQRFLRGPSLWSGKSCLVSVVDMGPLARALTTDVPGLGDQLLALFPGMHDFAEALQRGSFIAEALGRVALELQRMAGAPPCSRCAMTVHGKQAQVRIIIAGHVEQLAVQAFALARDILLALCAGKKVALRTRLAALRRIVGAALPRRSARLAAGKIALHFVHGHPTEHGQHEQQRLQAASQ